jgi:hypothetical protein
VSCNSIDFLVFEVTIATGVTLLIALCAEIKPRKFFERVALHQFQKLSCTLLLAKGCKQITQTIFLHFYGRAKTDSQ